MDQTEPAADLYDFIYKDSARITSYYAQLFKGHLTSFERTDAERSAKDVGGKVGVPAIMSAAASVVEETTTGAKRTFDPHEVITVDVLCALRDQGFVLQDVAAAPAGSLIQTKGQIVFIDGQVVEMATSVFGSLMSKKAAEAANPEETAVMLGVVQALMGKVKVPSAFWLRANDSTQFAGTIKEGGMDEPFFAYHFKHGQSGLSDVHLIGIKEAAANPPAIPGSPLFGFGQELAGQFQQLLFPPEAIRVIPLALFRVISPRKQ